MLSCSVYTDGSCRYNGSYNAIAGIGIYFDNPKYRFKNISKRLAPNEPQTSGRAELKAVVEVLKIASSNIGNYTIYTDSYSVINLLTDEEYGIISHPNNDLRQKGVNHIANIQRRGYKIVFIKVTARSCNYGNDFADRLAREATGAKKQRRRYTI